MLELYYNKGKQLFQFATLEEEQLELALLMAKQACLNCKGFIYIFEVQDNEKKEADVFQQNAPRNKYSKPGECVYFFVQKTAPTWGRLVMIFSPHEPKKNYQLVPPNIMAGCHRRRMWQDGYHSDRGRIQRKSFDDYAFNDLVAMGLVKSVHD